MRKILATIRLIDIIVLMALFFPLFPAGYILGRAAVCLWAGVQKGWKYPRPKDGIFPPPTA